MDISINCRAYDCYWNMGEAFSPDNCACREVEVAHTWICRSHITKEEAERRLQSALAPEVKE